MLLIVFNHILEMELECFINSMGTPTSSPQEISPVSFEKENADKIREAS
jgi:hypothetical protein